MRSLLRYLQQVLLSPADASHSSHHADGGAHGAEGHGLVNGHGEGKEPPLPPPKLHSAGDAWLIRGCHSIIKSSRAVVY